MASESFVRSTLNYTLDNGLTVTTVEPNQVWRVQYDDGEGTTIDITHTGLMDGYDINDPEQDPMTAARPAGSNLLRSLEPEVPVDDREHDHVVPGWARIAAK